MFIDRNTKQQWKKILHGSCFFLDFVNSLNLNDLQELSSGEKKEVWKLLTTIGQSTFGTESAYTNSSSNWDNTYILISSKNKKACVSNFFFWMWWFTPDSESIFSWLQYIEKIEQLHLKIYTIYIFCFIFGMHNIKELLIFLKYKNKLT